MSNCIRILAGPGQAFGSCRPCVPNDLPHRPTSLLPTRLRPQHSLIRFRYGSKSFVNELLDPLAAVSFGSVDVAFGIGGDAVDAIEFARLPPALAERRQHFQRVAVDDMNAVVFAVRKINVFSVAGLSKKRCPKRNPTLASVFHKKPL